VTPEAPDPAAIRLEVLSGMLAGREGWTRTDGGWQVGRYELITRRDPGLPYELWKGNRCVALLMAPRDAIAVAECLAEADGHRPTTSERLLEGLSLRSAYRSTLA
jgi:hypothetical protein